MLVACFTPLEMKQGLGCFFKFNYKKMDVLRYKSGLKKPPAIYDHLGPGRFSEVSDISHDG